jgi:hypothetical protein
LYLLGYLPKENRVYVMDKMHNVYSYALPLSVLIYQSAIVRRDFDAARKALTAVPQDQLNKMARFLETQDLRELALQVTLDPEHKFELAMHTDVRKLGLAKAILLEHFSAEEGGAEAKWKQLGDAALAPPASSPQDFDLRLAEECYSQAVDLGGLLLLYTSLADVAGIERLASLAEQQGRNNVAFLCYFLLHKLDKCVSLLVNSSRIPEAAFLTRTYAPSGITNILAAWKRDLARVSSKAAEALADPEEYPELFEDLDVARRVEAYLRANEAELLPAILYGDYATNVSRNLVQDMKEGRLEPVSDEQIQLLQQQANQAQHRVAGDEEDEEEEQVQEEEEKQQQQQPQVAAAAPAPAPVPAPAAPVVSSNTLQINAASSPANSALNLAHAASTPPSAAVAVTPSPAAMGPASASPVAPTMMASPAKPLASAVRSPLVASPAKAASPAPALSPSPSPAAFMASPAAASPAATSPAAAAAPSFSPMAQPKPLSSPAAGIPSPAAAISPAPAKSVTPVAAAAPPKPVTPVASVARPVASPIKAASPAAAPAKPVVAAPAPAPAAAELDLDGNDFEDFGDEEEAPAAAAAPVPAPVAAASPSPPSAAAAVDAEPSADQLAARLKEIEDDDDFGDF